MTSQNLQPVVGGVAQAPRSSPSGPRMISSSGFYGTVDPYAPRVVQAPASSFGRMPIRPPAAESLLLPQRIVEKPSPLQSPLIKLAPYVCEFFGTFMLVFTVACCSPGWWLPTAIALTLVALIYALGFISGGHLNPAISVAAFLAGKMSGGKCLCYIIVQLAGGILAALLFRLTFGFGTASLAVKIMPLAPFSPSAAAIVDCVYTIFLCFVALNTMCCSANDRNEFFAIAIGFVYVAGAYAARDISGALFNPSIALSLSLYNQWGLLFALVEVLGGLIAALLFRICRVSEYTSFFTFQAAENGAFDDGDSSTPYLAVRMLNEFAGAFWIVLTFGLNTVLDTHANTWSTAGAYISAIYAFSNVSFGYFNPALTFAMVLRGWCKTFDGWCYALAQLLAAVPAGLLVRFIHTQQAPAKEIVGFFTNISKYPWYSWLIVEFVFTFMLAYVVLLVATCEKHKHNRSGTATWPNFYFAFAIGLVMAGAGYAASRISGGYLNPALVLSVAVEGEPVIAPHVIVKDWPMYGIDILTALAIALQFVCYYLICFWYWLPEILGAFLAAFMFQLLHKEPEAPQKMLPIEVYS